MATDSLTSILNAVGALTPGKTATSQDQTVTDSGGTSTVTTENSGGVTTNSGRTDTTINSGRTDTSYNSGRTDVQTIGAHSVTVQNMLTDDDVMKLVNKTLESTQGLASITGGEKSYGIYGATPTATLASDLVARASAEAALKRAPQVTSYSAQTNINNVGDSLTTNVTGGSSSTTNIGGSTVTTAPTTTKATTVTPETTKTSHLTNSSETASKVDLKKGLVGLAGLNLGSAAIAALQAALKSGGVKKMMETALGLGIKDDVAPELMAQLQTGTETFGALADQSVEDIIAGATDIPLPEFEIAGEGAGGAGGAGVDAVIEGAGGGAGVIEGAGVLEGVDTGFAGTTVADLGIDFGAAEGMDLAGDGILNAAGEVAGEVAGDGILEGAAGAILGDLSGVGLAVAGANVVGEVLGIKELKCYITTAVCEFSGKPDDCDELTTLRRFRDTYMSSTPLLLAQVDEYYREAPKVVEAINHLPAETRAHVYTTMRDNYITPAVVCIKEGSPEKAYLLYSLMFQYARAWADEVIEGAKYGL